MMKRRIKILSAKQIDKDKWDQCVGNHSNGLIYSTSTYLDAMAQNWNGLVVDDYAAVMALPWKRKMRIRYGYVPAFIQQLGLIGEVNEDDLKRVLKKFYRFYALADTNFNFQNTHIQRHIPVIPRNNFLIDLSKGYEPIRSHYKNNLKENIKKAGAESLEYISGNIDDAVTLYHSHYKDRMKHIKEKHYKHFSALCNFLEKEGQCFVRSVTDPAQILAIGIFLKDNKRIYNIMNTTTQEGRKKEANHFLLDRVIQEFAGTDVLFDFEGSELPGVREFYEQFGPMNQPYFHYHYNGYTWPLTLLKR